MSNVTKRPEKRQGRMIWLRSQLIEDAKQLDSPGGKDITELEWSRIQLVDNEIKEATKDVIIGNAIGVLNGIGYESDYAKRVLRPIFEAEYDEAS